MKTLYKSIYFVLIIFFLFSLFFMNAKKVEVPKNAISAEVYYSNGSNGDIKNVKKELVPFVLNKKGEAYTLKNSSVVENLLIEYDAQLIFTEHTENGTSYYAYSKAVNYIQLVDKREINVHIHKSKTGELKIGFPLIFGSF